MQAWRYVFDCLKLDVDDDQQTEIQKNKYQSCKIEEGLLFMYSMETFLPYNLNNASRTKD